MLKKTLIAILFYAPFINAEIYQSNEDFINEVFAQQAPKPGVIWLKKERKKTVADILQHRPGFLRTRYWADAQQSVWILEETGKTKPITVGVVIENQQIKFVRVLAFRESRGWEVKHSFFTDQFKQLSLTDDGMLSTPIDGISGATLSVNALKKIARIALYLNQQRINGQ